jgi:isopentenyl-diphosphate delta-isomerase
MKPCDTIRRMDSQNYYKQKIMIAKCDKKGTILGEIERWEAHEKAILHRAFTVAIFYKGQILLQHRKHPVFDGVLDVTSSSHQIFDNGKLQDTVDATYACLLREWGVSRQDLVKQPEDLGWVYYRAKDSFSIYTEHELCNIVVCEVKELPQPNHDVSYGYSLATKKELATTSSRLFSSLAPWVKVMIKSGLL